MEYEITFCSVDIGRVWILKCEFWTQSSCRGMAAFPQILEQHDSKARKLNNNKNGRNTLIIRNATLIQLRFLVISTSRASPSQSAVPVCSGPGWAGAGWAGGRALGAGGGEGSGRAGAGAGGE